MYIDFKVLKQSVPMLDVLEWLEIKLKPEGQTFRGPCQYCERGGDRSFVATPKDHIFYCHSEGAGGDTIALVAKHFGCSTKEAAQKMHERFLGTVKSTPKGKQDTVPTAEKRQQSGEPLKPLENLSTFHEAIEALGLTEAVCRAIGIGYCSKGLMRGRVAFPIRLPDGTLVGYQGLATSPDQAPLLLFPKNLAEKCLTAPPVQEEKKSPDELRKMFRAV